MAHCASMAKHDSLGKAPLNDEATSREQKLCWEQVNIIQSVHFIMSLSTEVARLISNWKQACHAIQLLWVTVTLFTSIFFHIKM
jgi:hypothetical protein